MISFGCMGIVDGVGPVLKVGGISTCLILLCLVFSFAIFASFMALLMVVISFLSLLYLLITLIICLFFPFLVASMHFSAIYIILCKLY